MNGDVFSVGGFGKLLNPAQVRQVMSSAFEKWGLQHKKVLVIIPDSTRTAPMGMFFRLIHELIGGQVSRLDFLIALGTHPPMSETAINRMLSVSPQERAGAYADVRIYNHQWDDLNALVTLGVISAGETAELSQGRLAVNVPVRINKRVLDYDVLLVCGPVFPHEVVGFSGGSKYFFPGVSGAEVIDFTHWLGALETSFATIGVKDTLVRRAIERAADLIDRPKFGLCMVTTTEGLVGLFAGELRSAWEQAVQLSAQVHIRYVDKPYKRVLSILPEMYDDLWTGAKGMYKLEPVIEDGGEVVIYAPHISEVSYTHGRILDEIGYHVRDYFVKQWEKFKDYPWGVLAHSTHLRGLGTYENGVEKPRIRVTLATAIPPERCQRLNLGYINPEKIDIGAWQGREDEGILVVPHAGEVLYRLKEASSR